MKKGFSLLITLFFVLFLSVLGIMILDFSMFTNKHISSSTLQTRGKLLERAVTEYAIMAMQGHDYSKNCLKHIDIKGDKFFNISIDFHYFLTDCDTSKCKGYCSEIETPDINGSALIYVHIYSKSKDINWDDLKVTLQNP